MWGGRWRRRIYMRMGERRKCKVRVFVVVSLRETDQLFKKKKRYYGSVG